MPYDESVGANEKKTAIFHVIQGSNSENIPQKRTDTSHRLAGSFDQTVYDVAAQGVCHSPLPFPDASVDWLAACCGS